MLLIDNKLIFTFMPHTVAEVTKYYDFTLFWWKIWIPNNICLFATLWLPSGQKFCLTIISAKVLIVGIHNKTSTG